MIAIVHPAVIATLDVAASFHSTADGRLSPRVEPGLFEVRVSTAQLQRAAQVLQRLVDGALERKLAIASVNRTRSHRAGVGIGVDPHFTAIKMVEQRDRVPMTEAEIENWLTYNYYLRDRPPTHRPKANGRLQILLPRRYDRTDEPGWRCVFSDEPGRSLDDKLPDVLNALEKRLAADIQIAQRATR